MYSVIAFLMVMVMFKVYSLYVFPQGSAGVCSFDCCMVAEQSMLSLDLCIVAEQGDLLNGGIFAW